MRCKTQTCTHKHIYVHTHTSLRKNKDFPEKKLACVEGLKKTLCKETRKRCRKREKWERQRSPRVRARRPICDRVAQGGDWCPYKLKILSLVFLI